MKRILLVLEVVLLSVSAALLGYTGFVRWSARVFQAQGHRDLNHVQRNWQPVAPAEGSLLGEVEIPRIGLSSVILEGTEAGTLRRAVGHIPGTALPGQPGNLCLAGHRDTFFRPLRRVAVGDEVAIKSHAERVLYRVQSVRVVRPEDAEVLDNTPEDVVTLVTCYPFHFIGAAPKRFVVRAMRISRDPKEDTTGHASRPAPSYWRSGQTG
jgi:sortase A